MTASGTRTGRRWGPAGSILPSSRIRRYLWRHFRLRHVRAGRPPPQPRPARGRSPRRSELEFEEAVFGVDKKVNVRRHETCDSCRGSGRRRQAPVACKSCNGRGQVRYQQAFQHRSNLPHLPGRGQRCHRSLREVQRRGRLLRERVVEAKVPAGVEEHAHSFHRTRRSGRVQRAGRRFVYCPARQRACFL